MENYSDILNPLREFNFLGEKLLVDGTLLIGKAPHIAPLAWLHTIYSPLSKNEISFLESQLKMQLPKSFKAFMEVTNGLAVFNTTLSMYGLRKNYNRNADDVWQPFDIILPNTLEKPYNATKSTLIIGSYDWDHTYLYMDTNTEKIYFCERNDITPLFEWENLGLMLQNEIRRLKCLFDKNGRKLQVDQSTLPAQI